VCGVSHSGGLPVAVYNNLKLDRYKSRLFAKTVNVFYLMKNTYFGYTALFCDTSLNLGFGEAFKALSMATGMKQNGFF
jgi:hypothetical protein